MPPPSAPLAKPRRRRAAKGALIVAVTLIAIYLLREPLLGGILARVAADRLSAALGGPVRIAHLGGSWFGGVVVEGLAGEHLAGGVVGRVACDRLVIAWRLRDLVRGRGLAALTRVAAEGLVLEIDPHAHSSSAGSGGFDLARLPEPLPALDIAARVTVGGVGLGAVRVISDGRCAQLAVAGAELPVVGALDAFALSAVRSGDRVRIDGVDPIAGIVPRRIDLVLGAAGPQLSADLEALGATVVVTASTGAASLQASGLQLAALPAWAKRVLGAAAPSGGRLTLALRAERAGGWSVTGDVSASAVVIAGRELDRLRIRGGVGASAMRIDHAEANVAGVELSARDLAWRDGRPWPYRGRVELNASDLRDLLTVWLPAAPRPPRAITLRAALLASDGSIRSDGIAFAADGWRLGAEATLDRAGWLTADARLSVEALPALAWCIPPAAGSAGRGEVSVGYRGPLTRRGDGLPAGRATLALTGDEVVLARRRLGRLTIAGELVDGRTTLAIDSRGAHGAFAVAAAGWAEAGGAALHVERASGEWHAMPWALDSAADLRLGYGSLRLAPLTIHIGAGHLALAADLGDQWRARATLDQLPIATGAALLGLDSAGGTLTGSLVVDGPAARPTAAVILDLAEGMVGGRPARLALDLRQDADGLHIATGDVAWDDLLSVHAGGSWPLAFGRGGPVATGGIPDLRAQLAVPELSRLFPRARIAGTVNATASAVVIDGTPRAHLTALGRGLHVRSADPDAPLAPTLDAALDLAADAAGATLTARVRDQQAVVVLADLASRAALTARELLDPQAWARRPLGGTLALDGMTLTPFEPLAPTLLGLGGRLAGSLTIAGTVGDPQIAGALSLSAGEFKLRSDLPRFTAGSGTLTLAERVLTMDFAGELGYAPIACRGRASLDDRGVPALDLHLTGTNALLAQDRDLRLRATIAVGLAGPLDALTASGQVVITDALWSKRIDLLRASTPDADQRVQFFAIRGGPFSAMRLDLRISADRTLRLVNNLLNADCSLDLHLGGNGAVPVPEGQLWTTAARLSLPFSSLAIDRAEVRFTADNPFRPNLEASGRTRMQGFELVARASGPVDDVEVEVTATPPLAPEDAVLLLTTGSTRTALEAGGERGALTRVGTYLGQELLRKAAGPGNPDQEGLLDKVTLAIGEQTSRSGIDTIVAEVLLVPERRPPPRPRKGLRIGELVLLGERDRYDAFNLGLVFRLRFR